MGRRRNPRYLPSFDRLEARRPLAGAVAAIHDGQAPAAHQAEVHAARLAARRQAHADPQPVSASAVKPLHGYLLYRITNPNPYNNRLIPPFAQVKVQPQSPVPGHKYNILFLSVRNGTAQTFDAGDDFQVKFPGQRRPTPILTGDRQWKPGEVFVFYILTKKYYPLPNVVSSGFNFDLGGAWSVGIPGPSGIFVGLTYKPATFERTLNRIVAFGNGAQGGTGPKFGLPDTSIYEFVSAKTDRPDFSGYF